MYFFCVITPHQFFFTQRVGYLYLFNSYKYINIQMEPINEIKNKENNCSNNKKDDNDIVYEVISRWSSLQKIIKEEITLEEISTLLNNTI